MHGSIHRNKVTQIVYTAIKCEIITKQISHRILKHLQKITSMDALMYRTYLNYQLHRSSMEEVLVCNFTHHL